MTDEFLISTEDAKRLYTGAVADVMNSMGYRATVDPNIRPIISDLKVWGRAMTIKMAPARRNGKDLGEEAKAAAKKGDFVVIDTGGNWQQTLWGDNSSTAVRVRGAVAVMTDGACRDITEHIQTRFQVYCRMISPGMSRGILKTCAYNVPITCGGVLVEPGDIVFGDYDGVVVIPEGIAQEVLKRTLAFMESDQKVKELLAAGKSVKEAYAAKKGALG